VVEVVALGRFVLAGRPPLWTAALGLGQGPFFFFTCARVLVSWQFRFLVHFKCETGCRYTLEPCTDMDWQDKSKLCGLRCAPAHVEFVI
jgi:hypothetical protein